MQVNESFGLLYVHREQNNADDGWTETFLPEKTPPPKKIHAGMMYNVLCHYSFLIFLSKRFVPTYITNNTINFLKTLPFSRFQRYRNSPGKLNFRRKNITQLDCMTIYIFEIKRTI